MVIAPQPPTRVDAHDSGVPGQEVQVARALAAPGRQVRIVLAERVLPDLELRQACAAPHEVDAKIELPAPLAAGEHVLDRGDDVAGLQIAAAQAEARRVEVGHVAGRPGRQGRGATRIARPFSRPFDMAARISRKSGGSTASGWSTRSSTTTPFFAGEQRRDQVGRERAEHGEVEHARP